MLKNQVKKNNHLYKVSIIVPCYNTKPWLDECLQSLVSQTLQDIEIICVNDGSTDGTSEKLNEWQTKYPHKIKVIHQVNGGLSNARNAGMKIAQGKCIGFVDSDDCVDICMYETLYKVLTNNNADVVKCNSIDFTKKNPLVTKKNTTNNAEIADAIDIFMQGLHFMCDSLYRKSFLNDNNIQFEDNIRLGEDIIFSYDIAINKPKLVTIPNVFYFCRKQRTGQLTSIKSEKLYIIFDIFNCIENKDINKNYNNKLIEKIILRKKIAIFASYFIHINHNHKKDFLFQVSNNLFNKNKAIDIYKYLLTYRYRSYASYLIIPLFVVLANCCYLWRKTFFSKYNIFNKTTKGK